MLVMDGSTANRPGRTYGIFDYGIYVHGGQTKVLPYTMWMPLLDTEHAVRIPAPTPRELVVTSPRIRGLEVRIPANVVLQTAAGPLRWMSLTQIPVDRTPFPVPEGTKFYFTPQAHGAQVLRPDGTPSPRGVRMIIPNVAGLPAGLRIDLWSYETAHHGWYAYGQGTVTRDGRQILPDDGVEFFVVTCQHTLGADAFAPAQGTVVAGERVGDPVDPATGLFVYEKTDLVVPDVIPVVVSRQYRQLAGQHAAPVRAGDEQRLSAVSRRRQLELLVRRSGPGRRRPHPLHPDLVRYGLDGRDHGAHRDADAVLQVPADVGRQPRRLADRAAGRHDLPVRSLDTAVSDGDPGPVGQPADDRAHERDGTAGGAHQPNHDAERPLGRLQLQHRRQGGPGEGPRRADGELQLHRRPADERDRRGRRRDDYTYDASQRMSTITDARTSRS